MPVGPGAPSQLKSKSTVPAGSYMAEMLVSSLGQIMPGCGNGVTRLGTWPMDQLLSLTSDCSHHDGPCWTLSDPSQLTRPYPDLWTDFPASHLTCLIIPNLHDNLDVWLNLRRCSVSHHIALGSWPHRHVDLAEHF